MLSLKEQLKALIAVPSITPEDKGCQALLTQPLTRMGFDVTEVPAAPVSNFWAVHGTPNQGPLLVFAGHTDVVPTGDTKQWDHPPFTPTVIGDRLYGRGACDMKGSLAAMLVATEQFLSRYPQHRGQLGWLITSGEEGDHDHLGTGVVMSFLKQHHRLPDYCVIGEPSSQYNVGDTIKVGRRGSLSACITLHGTQGHVAYPHLADNPIHGLGPVITALTSQNYDQGNAHFPPTSFQITNISGGTGANNVIPGQCQLRCNWRFSTESTEQSLKSQALACVAAAWPGKVTYQWHLSGHPFLTARGKLVDAVTSSIREVTGNTTNCSTSGGTSDGRFIAPYGVEVVELGPVNATIHQVNEYTSLDELAKLAEIYVGICEQLLG